MKKYKIGSSTALEILYAADMTTLITESRTIITINMTGNGSLALDDDATPQIGDEVIVKATSDATARDLTFGAGFTAPVLAGVINKTKTQSFVYDGTSFIASGAPVQIN